MVKIEEKALIIFVPHPCPAEALKDLQRGIVAALKYQHIHTDKHLTSSAKMIDGNNALLDLLDATLNDEEED
jgi:hypothetical protein